MSRRRRLDRLSKRLLYRAGHLDADLGEIRRRLAAGANSRVTGSDGWTVLHAAILGGGRGMIEDAMILEALIEGGADIEARADTQAGWRWTPLHMAAYEGTAEEMQVLLRHGAKVDVVDSRGRTPLMLSVGDPDKIAMLCEAGADARVRDRHGRTALEVAKEILEGAERNGLERAYEFEKLGILLVSPEEWHLQRMSDLQKSVEILERHPS